MGRYSEVENSLAAAASLLRRYALGLSKTNDEAILSTCVGSKPLLLS
jgi:hypothetical protein